MSIFHKIINSALGRRVGFRGGAMPSYSIEDAVRIIAEANYAIAFTGAGVSAESGIPTFRDPGGIWDRFDPAEVGTTGGALQFALRYPERIRDFIRETVETFEKADPNPGHYGLADLEKMGILKSVVTQNIDDLHSIAGNTRVLEVHGNIYRWRCLSCQRVVKHGREDIIKRIRGAVEAESFSLEVLMAAIPRCECGGMMRPDVVNFGEAVQQMPASYDEARRADVVIILGTSGVVWPAAGVPHEARRNKARIIEINPTENAFQGITDVYIKDLSGSAMPRIVELVGERRKP